MRLNSEIGPGTGPEEFFTAREASRYLKSSERWLRDQPIPRVRVGRLVRYRKRDLDAFMASHLTGQEGGA